MTAITIRHDRPVLIAGPTGSGKSALALAIAQAQGGTVINADALQVFSGWRILTARPSDTDLAAAPHALYGHVPPDQPYSVGHWLRDLEPLLAGNRPIITGGTGLYFSALTEGLADIPATPPHIRAAADRIALADLVAALDPVTRSRIDTANRMRVQRAYEVQQTTGRPITAWQDETPPPRLPLDSVTALLLDAPRDWLTPRLAQRFDQFLSMGVLEEARAMLPRWNPADPAARAIGAAELIAHLRGEMALPQARAAAIIATRQYAKRQRTWFNRRMQDWQKIHMPSTDLSTAFLYSNTNRD